MAEAVARQIGGDSIRAFSAGSSPSGSVNPRAVRVMAEGGYRLTDHRSKGLTEVPDLEYDWVVTMGCGDHCPSVRARHRQDWEIPDPRDLDDEGFRRVRDLIESKVTALLSGLG